MAHPVLGAPAPAVFDFQSHQVRIVTKNGEPWFVASDVCNALGYSNTSKAVGDHLDADERASEMVPTPNAPLGVPTNIISESGLYALVLRSRKPEARKFAKWVTSEVLPAIRKTGQYVAQPYSVGPNDTLTAEQADTLRNLLTTACNKLPKARQGAFMMRGWSKLKAHFKVGYREIAQVEFAEAVSILARHVLEGEALDAEPVTTDDDGYITPAAPAGPDALGRYHYHSATADDVRALQRLADDAQHNARRYCEASPGPLVDHFAMAVGRGLGDICTSRAMQAQINNLFALVEHLAGGLPVATPDDHLRRALVRGLCVQIELDLNDGARKRLRKGLRSEGHMLSNATVDAYRCVEPYRQPTPNTPSHEGEARRIAA